MKNLLNKTTVYTLVLQLIKFGIVGIFNTLIGLAVYYLLVFIGANYVIANTMGFIISVINAYFWNKKYVFKKSTNNVLRSFFKTLTSYGMTFLLSTVLLIVMVEYLHISDKIAPIINLMVTIPLNFILNKFWAFK